MNLGTLLLARTAVNLSCLFTNTPLRKTNLRSFRDDSLVSHCLAFRRLYCVNRIESYLLETDTAI